MTFLYVEAAASSTSLAVSLKSFYVREAQTVWIFGKSPAGVQSTKLMATAHPTVAEVNSFFKVQVS